MRRFLPVRIYIFCLILRSDLEIGSLSTAEVDMRSLMDALVLVNFGDWSGRLVFDVLFWLLSRI